VTSGSAQDDVQLSQSAAIPVLSTKSWLEETTRESRRKRRCNANRKGGEKKQLLVIEPPRLSESDDLPPETGFENTELEHLQLNSDVFLVLSDDAEGDSPTEATALCNEVEPHSAGKEEGKEQSLDNISSEAAVPGAVVELDQSDVISAAGEGKGDHRSHLDQTQPGENRCADQPHQQTNARQRRRRRGGIKRRQRIFSQNRDSESVKSLTADNRQHGTYRKHQQDELDVSYALHNICKGYAQHESRNREKCDSVEKRSYKDRSSHYDQSDIVSASAEEKGDHRAVSEMQRAQSTDKKQTEQPRRIRNDGGTFKHLKQLSKKTRNMEPERKGTGNRSDTESVKSLTADNRQRGTYRRHQQEKLDVSYALHNMCKGYAQHESRSRETRDSVEKRYYNDRSSHYVGQCRHYRPRYLEMSHIRLSDLEDISSDEEDVEYQDGGDHCCRICHATFETISSLLQHLQSAAHEQVFHLLVNILKKYCKITV